MDASAATGTRCRPEPEEELLEHLVQARFEALAEWGIDIADARAIAQAVSLDIVAVVALLRRGCPSSLVLSILH